MHLQKTTGMTSRFRMMPDYIICDVLERKYEYCKYPQVRIFILAKTMCRILI